jgi:hypothetical protein
MTCDNDTNSSGWGMKWADFSESSICPWRRVLLLGCSGATRQISLNMRIYFRWAIERFGSIPCENCVPSSSAQNGINGIFRVTYMSSETIPIDGMQWTDSTHLAEHEKILPLNVLKVWVQSMWKLCSKQFNAKRNWRNFQSHVYVLGDNSYWWDAVDRLDPSRRT